MRFASETTVPVEKTRAEIEAVVRRYGASGFISGWKDNSAMVTFEIHERRIKFLLPLPDRTDREFTHYKRGSWDHARTEEAAYKVWEQACRQRWRALALAIKAKLEAVESKISTFEEEFMAHIVMPNGLTIGETIIPQLPQIIQSGRLPPLLPGIGESTLQ